MSKYKNLIKGMAIFGGPLILIGTVGPSVFAARSPGKTTQHTGGGGILSGIENGIKNILDPPPGSNASVTTGEGGAGTISCPAGESPITYQNTYFHYTTCISDGKPPASAPKPITRSKIVNTKTPTKKQKNTPSPQPSTPAPGGGVPTLSITYVPGPINYIVVNDGPNPASPNPQYSGQSGSSINAFTGQGVTVEVTESPSPEDSKTPVFRPSCSTSSKGVRSCHSVLIGFDVITTNWLASGSANLSQYYSLGETYSKSLDLSGGGSELSDTWKPMDLPNSGQWPNSQTQTYNVPITVDLQHNGVVENGSVTINVTGSLYGAVGTY